MFPGFSVKGQKGYGLQTDIAVIGDGEGTGEFIAEHQIVVPFLDAERRCFDHAPVILPDLLSGPTGLLDLAVFIQQKLRGSHFMVAHAGLPPNQLSGIFFSFYHIRQHMKSMKPSFQPLKTVLKSFA